MAGQEINFEKHKIRVPLGTAEKIYKDECMFCFDTPESPSGLYICMNNFWGLSEDWVEKYAQRTGNFVFLHLKRTKKLIPQQKDPKDPNGPEKKVTRLAIGVEGGFDVSSGKNYEYEENKWIVVLPGFQRLSLDSPGIPEQVQLSAASILAADSANKVEELVALAGTWDGEKRQISRFAENLEQLKNGVKIPPRGWKCVHCGLTDGLWLNLTDGSILCGRKEMGGNNHALEHYKTTGHPLVVKLGTITPDGKADIWSYKEDDMVEDPHLAEHLAHWGINILQCEKSDKSMIELEIEMNQKLGEWSTIQEEGAALTPMYGPGYTGLANLGNSCYMNSIMQVLFMVPDFQQRFYEYSTEILNNWSVDIANDFNFQMAKLAVGLLSGKYSKPPTPEQTKDDDVDHQSGIKPTMFRYLIGKGHPDFSTKRQQDAQEFLLHIINLLERNCRNFPNPANCFKFKVEDRIQCSLTQKVKYTYRTEYVLPLPIPLEAAINKHDVMAYEAKKKEAESRGEKLTSDELIRPHLTLDSCLEAFLKQLVVEDFKSSAAKQLTSALKSTRLSTFPRYLMVQLKKFTFAEDWTPKKLDVSVSVPDELDLSALRGYGKQDGEEELPEESEEIPEVQFDESSLSQLVDMGFPVESCKKALYFTQNSGAEPAMNWLMEHIADEDFSAPFVPPGAKKPAGNQNFKPNEEGLAMILSMGFTKDQALKALEATDNNLERAMDWIFSHQEELGMLSEPTPAEEVSNYDDGSGKYHLQAFISHMGSSSMVGHYVCHILRDGKWIIYNDCKVALSENPPKELGYLYLYKRV